MKAYSIYEASKKLTTSPNRLRKWEKELRDILYIPRSKNGSRFYTDKEISLLLEAKNLYDKKLPKKEVKEQLTLILQPKPKKQEEKEEMIQETSETSFELVEEIKPVPTALTPSVTEQNIKMLLHSLETYKQDFLQEVKEEIRTGLQGEVLNHIKEEIKAGQAQSAITISTTIERKNEELKDEFRDNIDELTDVIHSNAHQSHTEYEDIRSTIKKLSKISKAERKTYSKQWTTTASSSKEIKSMIEHLSKSNAEINKSMEQLHQNDQSIKADLLKEREQLRKEIREREQSFQDLVQSFRDTAVAIEKKKQWWKVWQS
ncbi:MerR family transcriptional regulator [Niallia nealsonii]|uniref:HTH merR-type domain-containing protein n=1 Tax=Niallia nealsonii TaxID=115979 RepID=A0A2N0Z2P8_9BACI|nr:MerR family transcriptional regulator [Niallia nealsonii]PKG23774.1 hypothetical protein CWS01_09730 [Niallia nealsonii]